MTLSPEFATAADMVSAIRDRTISVAELMDVTLRRIDRHNPTLNAIVWECRDQAMARARQADGLTARRAATGPLHGVPVTIKESFAYRESPNTWGLLPLEKAISPRTAVAIDRLESAGAIVVGKTNVPVMLADWQSYNPLYGTTNNPWDLSRTPGGSTGGGAAATAAGLGALTIGSDLSGSVRIPAHFCGVYGHKPSLDLIGTDGFQPGPWDGSPGPLMDLAVVGPMARGARDLALALQALGGPLRESAAAWTWRMPAPRHTRIADFRIGYVIDDPIAPIASDLRNQYQLAISALGRTRAKLEQGWPPGVDLRAAAETYRYLLRALVSADLSKDDEPTGRGGRDDDKKGDIIDHARWLRETQRRLAFRATWQQYFESHDVFLLPSSFTTAFAHDHSQPVGRRVIDTPEGKLPYFPEVPYWIFIASLAGLPATVAPLGLTEAGLPVGIQIVAPMWEDATSIEFAGLLSDVVGGFRPPPAFS